MFPGTEKAGDLIGRYKLREKIGEGGCGVVYMAEQKEPVRRMVALKVIKLGMDTESVIARFEAERQALALMDHPNIAKVLDAGASDNGRPFFVMELVRGVKITDYCDQNQLLTRERLELFILVCQAIQHAHQKGVIHRDIKPSNILITVNDGVPVPKVIDFGIAKATQGRLTDRTLFTAFQQFIGTPAYMSPEQAVMTSLDVDTRSDIYSLGVLLYELLTGHTPFDTQELMEAGLDEMRRTIREKEPDRPSTRLSRMPDADLTTVANRRQTNAPKLIHALRGDLDWIVMKALEKDRSRRYETANGLARDVERYMENQPVVARPPSKLYLFQKLMHRNKLAFAAAGAVALALFLGVVVSAWQASRAIRAEREQSQLRKEAEAESKEARREAKRAEAAETLAKERLTESEAISKFLTGLFQSPDPTRDGRTIKVIDILGAAVKKLDTELANQPARRASLQATLGITYRALGLYREAIPLQEKARDYYLDTFGPEHAETLLAMNNLGNSYFASGRREEALKLREQVLELRRKVSGPENPETIKAMNNVGVSYYEAGRRDEALKLREEVVALRRKVLGPEHTDTLTAMQNLANSYGAADRQDEALKLREEVLAIRRRVSGPEHLYTLMSMGNLAVSYEQVGRPNEALKLREEALAIMRKVSGPEHPDTLMAMHNLALSYSDVGRRDEALKLREEVLALQRKVSGPEHQDTLEAMEYLAVSYDEAGRQDEALALREQVLALSKKVSGAEHPGTLKAMQRLANSYCEAGRSKEAISLLASACELDPKDTDASLTLATWQTWFGQDVDYESTCRRLILQAEGTDQAGTAERAAKAACLRPSSDASFVAKALDLAQRAVELGKSNSLLPWYQLTLGLAEYRNGQNAAAEQSLTAAEQTLGDHDDVQGIAHIFHAMSLFRQNREEQARKLFNQAQAQMPPRPKDESKPIVEGRSLNHDLLIWWMASKEAKSLLDESTAAKP
jgi:tetratricopeptide (TPR) repeat protein